MHISDTDSSVERTIKTSMTEEEFIEHLPSEPVLSVMMAETLPVWLSLTHKVNQEIWCSAFSVLQAS